MSNQTTGHDERYRKALIERIGDAIGAATKVTITTEELCAVGEAVTQRMVIVIDGFFALPEHLRN